MSAPAPVLLSTPLIALEAVVLDTETTGLDAATARIVQIAAVHIGDGALAGSQPFDTLVDPGVAVPEAVSKVHGITTQMLAGKPRFADVAAGLDRFVGHRVVIGHTIGYDMTVLAREHAAAGLAPPVWRTLDVRHLAFYDRKMQYVIEPGQIEVMIGSSSEDIRLTGKFEITGETRAVEQVYFTPVEII